MPSLSVRERLPQGGKLRQPMSAILGDHELSVRRFLSGGFHLWEPLDGESAIVLSGGGAKGSFEIGVLHLLAESGLLERMNVTNVTGCSVGAINALALSEGRGRESVAKTIGIWFGHLKRPSDMYVNEPWLDEVIDLVPEIGQAVRWFKTPSWKAHQVEGPEVTLGGIVTTAGNLAFGNMTPTHLQEYGTAVMIPAINFRINRQRLEDLVATANNLFTIMPAIEKLDNAVDWNAIKNSSIDLRLVCVDLVTGKTVYINKEPKAVMPSSTEDPGAPLDWSNPISADVTSIGGKTTWRERVLMATLASAAIPTFFPTQRVEAGEASGLYVDGGVRDALPLFQAVHDDTESKIKNVISVSAGPVEVATGSESSKWGDPRWVASPRGANWIEQGLRSAGLGLAESHHQEAQPDFGRNDGRDHIHIAPHVTIHGTAEIAPGLIRINAAYGYMRAFDEFSARRSPAPSAAMISEMRRNSREIALLRRRVFRDEELLPVKIESGSTGRTFVRDGDRLRRIRAGKHQIAKLVEARILKFGEESVPLRLEADRPVNTWWTDWEQHDPDLRPVYAFGHFSYSTRIRIEHSGRPKDEAASSFNLIQVDLDPRVVAATSTV